MEDQLKKSVHHAAQKMNYLKDQIELEEVGDELFLWVATEYHKQKGHLPESWKTYMEEKVSSKGK